MKELVGKNKPFHSALDKAAKQIKRKVGTGAEFMQELMGKPGVKSSEIQDRGLNAIEHMPRMTLDQMKAELALRPVPTIQEKVLGEPIDQATLRKEINNFVRAQAKKYASEMSDTSSEYRYLAGEEMRRLRNNPEVPSYVAKILAQDDQPHHKEWTLPGGENYREMLIKAPKGEDQFPGVSGHFGGEPGILASLRLKDRTGPNGEKLLHLEELQSDWHQQGRDKGYMPSKDEIELLSNKAKMIESKGLDASPEEKQEWSAIMNRLPGYGGGRQVPNAPFKKNWEEMALKRLVHHAAEKGYHGIVVTPGQEQADRYSLAKHIDKLEYTEGGALYAWDKNGNEVLRQKVPEDEVANYVGKDLADKLLSKEKGKWNSREITGANLVTGGEGMKAFYDKKVPNILNSIGKKHGVKTQLHGHRIDPWPENEMDRHAVENYKGPVQVHHFPITEPMRQDILKNGLPLYNQGGTIHKAVGGAVQPTIPQMKMQLLRSNPAAIQSLGANEAPDMSPKTYLPPDKQTGKFIPPGGAKLPAGGIDMNPQQPGQQLMPQQPMQQPTNQQPQAPQGMQPQGQQDQGGNILQMTPQGQTMAALGGGQQPQQPQRLATGGGVTVSGASGSGAFDLHIPISVGGANGSSGGTSGGITSIGSMMNQNNSSAPSSPPPPVGLYTNRPINTALPQPAPINSGTTGLLPEQSQQPSQGSIPLKNPVANQPSTPLSFSDWQNTDNNPFYQKPGVIYNSLATLDSLNRPQEIQNAYQQYLKNFHAPSLENLGNVIYIPNNQSAIVQQPQQPQGLAEGGSANSKLGKFLTHLQKHGHKKGGKISQDAMRCELTMKKGK